jgi:hypothetical protein
MRPPVSIDTHALALSMSSMPTATLQLRKGAAPRRTAITAPIANSGASTASAMGRCTTAGWRGVGMRDESEPTMGTSSACRERGVSRAHGITLGGKHSPSYPTAVQIAHVHTVM